jgi:hypothetical protein
VSGITAVQNKAARLPSVTEPDSPVMVYISLMGVVVVQAVVPLLGSNVQFAGTLGAAPAAEALSATVAATAATTSRGRR